MAIENLMNHRARVWRRQQSRGTHAQVTNAWDVATPTPSVNNLWTSPQNTRVRDIGGGEATDGVEAIRWYMTAEADVTERDVVELVAGPEAPSYWLVQSASSPGRPNEGRHHWRIAVEPYHGEPPTEGES